jgi:WD40 repeat protein
MVHKSCLVLLCVCLSFGLAACTGLLPAPRPSPSPFPTGSPQLTASPSPQATLPQATAEKPPSPTPISAAITPTFAACQPGEPFELVHGELRDLAVSPDGRWLATASSGGVYLHDAASLHFVRPLTQERPFSSLAFAPDSKTLAVGSPGQIQVLDAGSGKVLQSIETGAQNAPLHLAFTPDGTQLVGLGVSQSGSAGAVTVWNLASGGQQEKSFPTYGNPTSLALSPDGATLALGTDAGRIELFDWEKGARLAVLREAQGDVPTWAVSDLDFSPDGNFLASVDVSPAGGASVWSLKGNKRLVEQYASAYPAIHPSVAFTNQGKTLLSATEDLAVAWDREKHEQTGDLWGYSSMPLDMATAPDGSRLAWVARTGLVRVYPGIAPLALSKPGYQVLNVAFISPNKVAIGLYASGDLPPGQAREIVQLWNTSTGQVSQTYTDGSAAAFPNQLPPAAEVLALADSWGNLRLEKWDGSGLCLPGCACSPVGGSVKPENCAWKLPHDLSPLKMLYAPDDSLLAVAGVAGSWHAALLWDPAKGEEKAWFPGGHALAFDPSGRWLAAPVDEISSDHTVVTPTLVLYPLTASAAAQRFLLPASAHAAFSPDGGRLATGISTLELTNPTGQEPPPQAANGLIVWDTGNWKQLAYLPLDYGVTALSYFPKDALAAGTEAGRILLWKPAPCAP